MPARADGDLWAPNAAIDGVRFRDLQEGDPFFLWIVHPAATDQEEESEFFGNPFGLLPSPFGRASEVWMATWAMNVIETAGYPGLAFLMFLENVFPPIPSEVVMPLAGYMVSRGKLGFGAVVLSGMVGSILGALPLYYLGRKITAARLRRLAARRGRWLTVAPSDLDTAQNWFDRHGASAVFLCRLVPAVRSLISIPAGLAEMNLGIFLLVTALGTAMWSALLTGAGYFMGSQFERVGEYLDPLSWLVIGIVVAIYAYRVVRHRGVVEG